MGDDRRFLAAAACMGATANLWSVTNVAPPRTPRPATLATAWALYGASVVWCFSYAR